MDWDDRTKRLFIATVGSALGVDQSYSSDDTYIYNPTGAYQVAGNPGYVRGLAYGTEGLAQSQLQNANGGFLMLLLLGGLAYLALR